MYGVLIFGILYIITLQNVQSKEINFIPERVNYPLHAERSSRNFRESRQLKDVWNTIKNSAKMLWNSVKIMVINTKGKIKGWLLNVKTKAKDVIKQFEERVEQIREKGRKVINEIVGTGHLVKECIKKDGEAVKQILKQIVKDVSSCISENLKHVSKILETKDTITIHNSVMEQYTYEFNDINETKLIAEIDISLNECLEHIDAEECMLDVKKDFLGKIENMENDILKHKSESRNKLDDLLDSLMNCSVDGLLGASNVIADETVHVIACVMNDKHDIDKKKTANITMI